MKLTQTIGWALGFLTLGATAGAEQVIEIHPDDPGLTTVAWPSPLQVRPPPPPISDPAVGRNATICTAEISRRGELTFTSRALLSTELTVGVSNWLELGLKTTPILLLFPEIGPQRSLWLGSLRLRLVGARYLSLTADSEGLSVADWAGIRAGMTIRLGVERVAFHGSASGLQLWEIDRHSCESCPRATHSALLVSGGAHLRVHRRVKLMLDLSYYRDAKRDLLLSAPAVRVHGQHFAADFGLMLVSTKSEIPLIPLPLINLSVSY